MAGARSLAARAVGRVLGGQSLAAALPPALAAAPPRDRGLVQELCYGALRWYFPLNWLLERLLTKPLKPGEHAVRGLLLTGLHQIIHLRIPDHAAVAATVAAARELNRPWAAGLTNAVLRSFLRRRDDLLAALAADPDLMTAHPPWLLARLRADWPADWPAIVAANNAHPPQGLRVNRRRLSRADYLHRLAAAGIDAAPCPVASHGVVLARPVDVERLPGFADGLVSVQDPAAQLAAELLDLQPGQRVLDAAAAPGGKTGHILEIEPAVQLTALDLDAARLERVGENLVRLGLAAQLVAGDALEPAAWWDGRPYDRILLDAPCSATGVIRRHPDIKLLRQESDIAALAQRQSLLLERLWPLLAPGGRLVYATCSVLSQENARVVAGFAARTPIRERVIAAAWGRAQGYGRQILPAAAGMDGFYYACLVKPTGG